MAIEGMSHPRDARAAWKLALGWGAILACAEMVNATTEQFAPMEIKRVITGNRTASKELMIKTITELRPEIEWPRKKSTHEHAADAIGAALTWLRAYDYEW
jgi:Holliday junction resolvasome RuvABC endonuclease subunit